MKAKPCAFCKTEHVSVYKYCSLECYDLAEKDRARKRHERGRDAIRELVRRELAERACSDCLVLGPLCQTHGHDSRVGS